MISLTLWHEKHQYTDILIYIYLNNLTLQLLFLAPGFRVLLILQFTWCNKCVHMSTLCQVATVGWRKITFNCYMIDCNAINTTCFVKWLSSWSMQVKDWRRKVNKLQALAARGLPKNSNTFRELIGGCFRKLVSPDPMCNVSHNLMYHNQWGL